MPSMPESMRINDPLPAVPQQEDADHVYDVSPHVADAAPNVQYDAPAPHRPGYDVMAVPSPVPSINYDL
jgi:hypothetical protein